MYFSLPPTGFCHVIFIVGPPVTTTLPVPSGLNVHVIFGPLTGWPFQVPIKEASPAISFGAVVAGLPDPLGSATLGPLLSLPP